MRIHIAYPRAVVAARCKIDALPRACRNPSVLLATGTLLWCSKGFEVYFSADQQQVGIGESAHRQPTKRLFTGWFLRVSCACCLCNAAHCIRHIAALPSGCPCSALHAVNLACNSDASPHHLINVADIACLRQLVSMVQTAKLNVNWTKAISQYG